MDDNSNQQPSQAPVQPQSVQPVQPPAPQPHSQPLQSQPVAPAPKKSKTVLFVILGAAIVLIAALLVGFLVIKTNADKAATAYTSSLNGYIDDLATAASDAADAPTTLADDMKSVDMPELKEVFLSGVSSKYGDAKKAGEDLKSKVAGFNDRAAEIVALKKFDNVTSDKIEEMRSVMNTSTLTPDNAISRFKEARTILEETVTATKDAKVPSELSSAKSDLIAAYEDELIAINLVISAYGEKNVDDYQSALSMMSSAAVDENAAWAKFEKYLSNLSSKIDTLSEDIESAKTEA